MTFCWYCRVNYLVDNQREKISHVNIFSLAAPVVLVLIVSYANIQKPTAYYFIPASVFYLANKIAQPT